MANPLNQPQQSGSPSRPNSFTDFVSNIKDPQAYATSLLQQNPGAQAMLQQIANPKQVAYQLAQKRGISPQQIDQLFNTLNSGGQQKLIK